MVVKLPFMLIFRLFLENTADVLCFEWICCVKK